MAGQRLICACALLAVAFAGAGDADAAFELPEAFLGAWQGVPYASVLGPWTGNNMTFAISRAASGDYRMVTNLKYDARPEFSRYWSWQRSYVKSTGLAGSDAAPGDVLHCPGPRSPQLLRQAMMSALAWPKKSSRSVTFCLKKWQGYVELQHPFPFESLACFGDDGCGCFNWTLSLDEAGQSLDYQVSMAGAPGLGRSAHLWARFRRVADAHKVTAEMPGEDFVCEYGGRDGHIVEKGNIAGRCPFAGAQEEDEPDAPAAGPGLYPHCYRLNDAAGLVLQWALAGSDALRVRVSAKAAFGEESYVALGFRPLGRASSEWARDHGTGREQRFGMGGADMVLGHAGGLQRMYAEKYTGAPVPDESLNVTEARAGVAEGRVFLEFTRPLVGGRLHARFGANASLADGTGDVLWAVGRYDAKAGFSRQHGLSRGWREVNWTDPEFDARPLESLRPYKCAPATEETSGASAVSVAVLAAVVASVQSS